MEKSLRNKKIQTMDSATCFLIIISAFLNLIIDIEYGIFSPEVLVFCFLAASLCGAISFFVDFRRVPGRYAVYSILIIFFIDLQFDIFRSWGIIAFAVLVITGTVSWLFRKHLGVILFTVFAVINIATLVLPVVAAVENSFRATDDNGPVNRNLPLTVHLVLDEQIGVEGIPTDIPGGAETRDALLTFFREYGFHTFGGAYSEYFNSTDSAANLLNLGAFRSPQNRYYNDKLNFSSYSAWVLKPTAYFEKMNTVGYRIHVNQSTYMDYCREGPVRAGDCFTYKHYGVESATVASLNVFQRLRLITGIYGKNSFFLGEFRKLYEFARRSLGSMGTALPAWRDWDGRVVSISTMPAIDRLVADIETGRPGNLYFAHLLMPHYPYIYDRNCRIRTPVLGWKGRIPPAAEDRAAHYVLYFDQIQCTLIKLRGLFERMKAAGNFDDATIIIHGDHGSRILLTDPYDWTPDDASPRNIRDGFSTLFTVKAPGIAPGYDREVRSTAELLKQVV